MAIDASVPDQMGQNLPTGPGRGFWRTSLERTLWRRLFALGMFLPFIVIAGIAISNWSGMLASEQHHNYHVVDDAANTLESWPGTIQQIATVSFYGSESVQTDEIKRTSNPNIGPFEIAFYDPHDREHHNNTDYTNDNPCYYTNISPFTDHSPMQVEFEKSEHIGGGVEFVVHGFISRIIDPEPHQIDRKIDHCFTSRVPFGRLVSTDMTSDDTLASHVLILDKDGKVIAQTGNSNLALEGLPPTSLAHTDFPATTNSSVARAKDTPASTRDDGAEQHRKTLATDLDQMRGVKEISVNDAVSLTIHGAEYQAYVRPLRIPNASVPACNGNGQSGEADEKDGRHCYIAVLFPRLALTRDWLRSMPVLSISVMMGLVALGLAIPLIRFLLIGGAESASRLEIIGILVGAPATLAIGMYALLLCHSLATSQASAGEEIGNAAQHIAGETGTNILNHGKWIADILYNLKPGDDLRNIIKSKNNTCLNKPDPLDVSLPSLNSCFFLISTVDKYGKNFPLFGTTNNNNYGYIATTSKKFLLFPDEISGKSNKSRTSPLVEISHREYFQMAQNSLYDMKYNGDINLNFNYVRSQSTGIDLGIVLASINDRDINSTDLSSNEHQKFVISSFIIPSLIAPVLPYPTHFAVINTSALNGDARRLPVIAHDEAGFVTDESLGDDAKIPEETVRDILNLGHSHCGYVPNFQKPENNPDPCKTIAFDARIAGKSAYFSAVAVPNTQWVVITWQNNAEIESLSTTTSKYALIDFGAMVVILVFSATLWYVFAPRYIRKVGNFSASRLWPLDVLELRYGRISTLFACIIVIIIVFISLAPTQWWRASITLALAAGVTAVFAVPTALGCLRLPNHAGKNVGSGNSYTMLVWILALSLAIPLPLALWFDAAKAATDQLNHRRLLEATHDLRDRDRLLLHSILPATHCPPDTPTGQASDKTRPVCGTYEGLPGPPERSPAPPSPYDPNFTEYLRRLSGFDGVTTDSTLISGDNTWLNYDLEKPQARSVRAATELYRIPAENWWQSILLFIAALLGLAMSYAVLRRLVKALCGTGLILGEPANDLRRSVIEAVSAKSSDSVNDLPKLTLVVANDHDCRGNLRAWAMKQSPPSLIDLTDLFTRLNSTKLQESNLRALFSSVKGMPIPGPEKLLFEENHTIVMEGLTLLMHDPLRRRAVLVLLESAARKVRAQRLKRVILMVESTPMERIIDQFDRESENRHEIDRDFDQEELRWARLFQKFSAITLEGKRMCTSTSPSGRGTDPAPPENPNDSVLIFLNEISHLPVSIIDTFFDRKGVDEIDSPIIYEQVQKFDFKTPEAAVRYVQEQAVEYYERIWFSATRWERIILDALAHDHFVNLERALAIRPLVRQGVVLLDPAPRLFNASFAAFVRQAERPQRIAQWRERIPKGQWQTARFGILTVTTVVLGFHAYTLSAEGENPTAILSALLAGAPALINALIRPGAAIRTQLAR